MRSIWCNVNFTPQALAELEAGTVGYRLIEGRRSVPDQETLVAFGQPDPGVALGLPNLGFIQITSAGYTRYDTEDFQSRVTAKGVSVANSSSVFDEPCAQHLLAFMLAAARQLPQTWTDRTWSVDRIRLDSRLLQDQTVLLVGYGAIARRMVELLAPFRLRLVGIRRNPTGTEAIPTHPISSLPNLLTDADHVANILPANGSTDGLLNARMFGLMKPGAVFYNIGRGTTVDQPALVSALESGQVGAAYLDVTDPEPLPRAHPLWSAPNCFITPHTAGGHRGEERRLVAHFLQNLRRFESGETLTDRVF